MAEAGRRPQPAGRIRWRLGVLMAATLVAGCQTIVPRGERPPTKGPDRPTQVDTPITPGLPDDRKGSSTLWPGELFLLSDEA